MLKIFTKKQKGFTLIELLVVISIIGILSFVILDLIETVSTKDKDDERQADTEQIETVSTKDKNDKRQTNWSCGDNLTFTYRGSSVIYGTVSRNGECWMDRNLGASQVATASNDYLAYGDLFQWGRLDDGHQIIVWTSSSGSDGAEQSRVTSTNSSSDIPGHSNFILVSDYPYDWYASQNNDLWQGINGTNNPCPSGWRIPTEGELNTECLSWDSLDSAGAFASTLKFVVAGYRGRSSGVLYDVGSGGFCWGSTVDGADACFLSFYSSNANMYSSSRAGGFSVRCIKD